MIIENSLFYIMAIGTVGCSLGALLAPSVVYGILYLIGAFFHAAALFILLGAEFLAFVMILVYVGSVALLFLFIVMTMRPQEKRGQVVSFLKKPILYMGGVLFLEMLVIMGGRWHGIAMSFAAASTGASDNLHAVGCVLYTDYFLPFQIVGILLLLAMLSAVLLIDHRDRRSKNSRMRGQWEVRAQDRVTLREVPPRQGISL